MTITEALVRLGDLFRSAMQAKAPKNTGALRDSIKYQVDDSQDGVYQLKRSMLKYGMYQDGGVKGTKSSPSPDNRSFYPMGQFKYKVIGPNDSPLEYPVRLTIAQHGLKPKPFVGIAIDQVMANEGKELLTKASVDTIQLSVKGELQDVKIKA